MSKKCQRNQVCKNNTKQVNCTLYVYLVKRKTD